jgi:predicted O-methyltransferase YrrM
MSEWIFPAGVHGWLSFEEGKLLAELATDKVVLEIGSYHGRSTICMAQTAKIVHAIDWGYGGGDVDSTCSTVALLENLRERNLMGKVFVHVGRVEDMPFLLPAQFDMVYVDGQHDVKSARRDFVFALHCLKPDGILAAHDWDRPEVRQALREATGATNCIRKSVELTAVFTKGNL